MAKLSPFRLVQNSRRYAFAACGAMFCVTGAWADDLTVSAAASLANAFGDIGKAYEAAHPGTHVVFNFGASDVLLKQIEQGAPADVFASADEITMDRAAESNHVDKATRKDLATNTLVLIVPESGAAPTALGDLQKDAYKRIAIGNPDSVPAGRYAKQALTDAKLWDALSPKFVQAQNVRQTLDYVARGEADAGFVYATDASTQAGKVKVALTVPTAKTVSYPLATTAPCVKKQAACDFVQYVLSKDGQTTLQHYGFSPSKP